MSLLLLLGGSGEGDGPTGDGVAGPGGTTLHVEFSPTTTPLETPSWVDISSSVSMGQGITVTRGRSTELDKFQAGTASFRLKNTDRTFDPEYSSGTYYGSLKPLRRFRITVDYNSVNYPLFVGFCRGWPQGYDVSNKQAWVDISLVDGFGLLALAGLSDAFFTLDDADDGLLDEDRLGGDVTTSEMPNEYTGERVERLLDLAGWPDDLRSIATGASVVGGPLSNSGALAQIQLCEESEDGFFFISSNGTATFLGRESRQTVTRLSSTQETFSDDGSDAPFSGLDVTYDDQQLWNDVRVTDVNDFEGSATDSTSVDNYFRRVLSKSTIVTTKGQATDLATVLLARHKDPKLRVPSITVKPLGDPTNDLPSVLARELLDRVVVERTPQGVGSQIQLTETVEKITHRITDDWVTDFELSLTDTTTYFVLDDADLGELDDDVLAA